MRFAVLLFLATSGVAADDFPSFMAGSWGGTVDGVRMEEHWTSAEANLMVGMHRDIRPDGTVFFEFLRIEKRDGILAYVAQPRGGPATEFALSKLTSRRVVFENRRHDYPQRIIYWRNGDRLCARVEGPSRGQETSEQWCWERMKR